MIMGEAKIIALTERCFMKQRDFGKIQLLHQRRTNE